MWCWPVPADFPEATRERRRTRPEDAHVLDPCEKQPAERLRPPRPRVHRTGLTATGGAVPPALHGRPRRLGQPAPRRARRLRRHAAADLIEAGWWTSPYRLVMVDE